MSKFYTLIFFALLLGGGNISAQVTVKADRPDATYEVGEQMNFVVSGGFGQASYVIKYDREGQAPNIAEGTVQVNGTGYIPFKLDHPGMVFCVVILNGQRVIAGAAFSPFQIQPYEEDPDDFDQFWQGWKNKLASVPINPVVTPLFPDPSPLTRDFRINLGHIDGRRVYGYLSIPNAPGKYPAIITHSSFGGFANLCIPRPEIAINANVISLSIWMHNREPDQNDPTAYMPEIWDDRDRIFYRYGVLGIIRAIDYLYTMPEFDGQNVGLSGVSEGGGLSILAAGVDDRVDIVAASVFALSEHTGFKYDRASGFPFFILRANITWPPEVNENAVQASKYYDAVRAAKRFKGPVYAATGYVDETVMPATNFGAFNQFRGSTVLIHKIEGPHLSPPEFGNGKFNFFRKHFNIPGNTGYFADAGDDIFNAAGTVSLNGRVELNSTERNDFPVEWEVVSGPGNVIFSNKNAQKTDVNFTEQGEYVLRFRATDQSMLASNTTYFSISDHVVISTSGNSNPCVGDITPPVAICKDLTIELDNSGSVTVFANQIDNGSTDDCTGNNALVFSLENSIFNCSDIGTQTIEMTVIDEEGNTSKCTSNVTVSENITPTALCQNKTILLDANGNASITPNEINNNSFDNCTGSSDLFFSLNQTDFNCSDVTGAATIELSVTDAQGNVGKCYSTVTVSEAIPPTAVCNPLAIELDANGNGNLTATDFGEGSSDNCTAFDDLRISLSRTNFGCWDIGTLPITMTVNDDAGNVSMCTADIAVREFSPPTAVCKNLSKQLGPTGILMISSNEIENGSWDNCTPSIELGTSIDKTIFDCSNIGSTTVKLTISDKSGNTSTCDSEITISDKTAPTANCKNLTILLDSNGFAAITPFQINDSSNDNCPAGLNLSINRADFDCTEIGDQSVILSVSDGSGNTSTCSSNIKVKDATPPNAVCKDVTIELNGQGTTKIDVESIDNGSFDNCTPSAELIKKVSQNELNCNDLGIKSIDLIIEDASGNSQTCRSEITVLDVTPPMVLCKDLTVRLDSTDRASINFEQVENGSFDNCTPTVDLIFSLSKTDFTRDNLGDVVVELTAADASGNIAGCNAVITVEAGTTSSKNLYDSNEEFEIFPNPANDQAIILLSNQSMSLNPAMVQIFNISGIQVQNFSIEKLTESSFRVNLKNLSSGIYYVALVEKNGKTAIKKLIVE